MSNRERRETARRAAEQAAKRTPQERLRRLDERLGVGIGAKKERGRIMAALEGERSEL
jgi:hypothetical protein